MSDICKNQLNYAHTKKEKPLAVLFTYRNAAEAIFPVPQKNSCKLVWGQPRMSLNKGRTPAKFSYPNASSPLSKPWLLAPDRRRHQLCRLLQQVPGLLCYIKDSQQQKYRVNSWTRRHQKGLQMSSLPPCSDRQAPLFPGQGSQSLRKCFSWVFPCWTVA